MKKNIYRFREVLIMYRELAVSKDNKTLLGVCGGIGEYCKIDPTVIRIVFILMTFIFLGSPILIYIILYIIMPKKNKKDKIRQKKEGFYDFSEFDE